MVEVGFYDDVDLHEISAGEEPMRGAYAGFPQILTGEQLIETYPERRPYVIDGLIREGDVMNVIAAPKVGKSWLAIGLALSVAAGREWLDHFDTQAGRVIYVDNELHPTDMAFRLAEISAAMGLPSSVLRDQCQIASFRGVPAELSIVCSWLRSQLADQTTAPKMIVIDTLSKMLAGDRSENDNLYVRSVYTALESLAADLGAAIVIIHHTSRGDQSEKATTDVGAGAGSQSRACDCHMVVRPHKEEGWFVLDSMVRSFADNPSLSIRWDFPLWQADTDIVPELASKNKQQTTKKSERAEREVLRILRDQPGQRFSVSRLDGLIQGISYKVITPVCERLEAGGFIKKIDGTYQGRAVTYFYV